MHRVGLGQGELDAHDAGIVEVTGAGEVAEAPFKLSEEVGIDEAADVVEKGVSVKDEDIEPGTDSHSSSSSHSMLWNLISSWRLQISAAFSR